MSSFDSLTNLYSLSKTLRFELKPVGKTQKLLDDNKIFEKVEKIYLVCKKKRNKTNIAKLEYSAKKLRTAIVEDFNRKVEELRDEYLKEIGDKKKKKKTQELKGMDLFFKVEVFGYLKQKYLEAKINGESIFNPFNKFGGYFRKFHETRKNFYKDDGTSKAIPTRIINVNLEKFLENKKIFDIKYFQKYESIFTEDDFPVLQKFINENKTYFPEAETLFKKFINSQRQQADEYNIDEIYVANRFINLISNKWFAAWNTIRNLLRDELNLKKAQKKFPDFIPVATLKTVLKKAKSKIDAKDLFRKDYKEIIASDIDFYQIFIKIWEREFDDNIKDYNSETGKIEQMISEDKQYLPNKKEKLKNGQVGIIHNEKILDYAQSVLNIYQMIKYFSLEKGKEREWNPEGLEEDSIGSFYDEFNKYYENVNTWKYLNEFRNYLTKKPYRVDKIKLNFECSSLLGGWSQSYESNGAFIFEKNGKYYIGIINGTKFSEKEVAALYKNISDDNICKRMMYDFQKPDFKNFPRLFIRSKGENFAPAVEKYHLPIHSILEIYDNGLYKTENKNNPSYQESLNKMIDYFKLGIKQHESYKHFNFKWQDSTRYKNISDFYNDVTRSCYEISWENTNFSELHKLVEKGRIYLLQIYNKDFELDESIAPAGYVFKGKSGNKNLHTIYWKALFGDKNLEKTILKLN